MYVVFCSARFKKYQTARNTGLAWSYGLLPTMIFSFRFDESGLCPIILCFSILAIVTVQHVWIGDWAYQFYLRKIRRQYWQARRAAMAHKKLRL